MYRLGLRLTLRSGQEALVRLILTMVAVAIGVVILLAVLADFHAFQVTNDKPSWESTTAISSIPKSLVNIDLWNYSNDIFKGQTIERLDIAPLGPLAPTPPGIAKLPGVGQYYASPALATLLRSEPPSELSDRFPGSQIGTIGEEGLTSPSELAIYIGYAPASLKALSSTIGTDQIATGPQTSTWTNYFRYAFGVGLIAFVFPILILIGTATRLAAARREERYAAMRLVGATPVQISVISSVDAVVGSLFGTILGIGLFTLLQPALAGAAITGARYFAGDVTPTIWGYVGVLVAVPAVSAIASLLSLRRVQISPLGVSRKTTPPSPSAWRIAPLLFGVVLFSVGLLLTTPKAIGGPIYPGILVIMIGLVVAGPWLTAKAAEMLAKIVTGASSLLAARRLDDNPKAAFRSVSGLVLAVFLGTIVAALLPAIETTIGTPSATSLSNVLLEGFASSPVCGNNVNCAGNLSQSLDNVAGLTPDVGHAIISDLQLIKGTTVIPIYSNPSYVTWVNSQIMVPSKAGGGNAPGTSGHNVVIPASSPPDDSIVSCAGLTKLVVMGQCKPGEKYVYADASNLTSDNPMDSTKPIASPSSAVASSNVAKLNLEYVLVKSNNPDSLEQVRTFLATHSSLWSDSGTAPRTFGEAVQAREGLTNVIQRLFYIAVALTLFVAGCSLAVSVGGSMVERKRPFSLLRLSGTPVTVLYRVVLMEAVLPLVTATIVAAGIGYGIAALGLSKIAPKGTHVPVPGHTYFLLLGAGLAVSLLVIILTLPILGRITRPENMRFE